MNQQSFNSESTTPHFHIGDTVKRKTDTQLMHVIAYKQQSENDEVLCSWEDEEGEVLQHYFKESDLYLVEENPLDIH